MSDKDANAATEAGKTNPDPTLKKGPGQPGTENVPPRGGEDMTPADGARSPAETQKQMKRDA